MHQDLTAPVLAGLAWYYLLAAMMNAAAAAYLAYGEMVSAGASRLGLAPKTRRMPVWLIGAYVALNSLAMMLILFRHALPGAVPVAYGFCAAANVMLAVMSGADAAHFAEMKAHGHGEGDPSSPRRSTITSPPSGSAVQSTALSGRCCGASRPCSSRRWSITYILGGEILMPQFARDGMDLVAGPTTFFVGATLAFIAVLRWRRFFANGLVGWAVVNLFLLFFGLSMTDFDFRRASSRKPDNTCRSSDC